MIKLLAYHNDQSTKDEYLDRVRAHRAADEIVQGQYWRNGKGCAIGCTLHSGDHEAYEAELGIPVRLAHLEDNIFEGLGVEAAKAWPERFLSAINPGADLSMVWPKFALWLLTDSKHGVIQYAGARDQSAIVGVANLYRTWLDTGVKPSASEFRDAARDAADAARAAYAAAAYAVYAAVYDARAAYAAVYAARAAVYAAYAAADAAHAAAAYAARDAADAAPWETMADKLEELLKDA